MRLKLEEQTTFLREKRSRKIRRALASNVFFKRAGAILFFASTNREVNLWLLMKKSIRDGKSVFLPRIIKSAHRLEIVQIHSTQKDLIEGSYGIREPRAELAGDSHPKNLDLVLVPGLAFDAMGGRLGQGMGCYDRFLKKLAPQVKRYGICFDFQLCDLVPTSKMDIRMDQIVTEQKAVNTGRVNRTFRKISESNQ